MFVNIIFILFDICWNTNLARIKAPHEYFYLCSLPPYTEGLAWYWANGSIFIKSIQ